MGACCFTYKFIKHFFKFKKKNYKKNSNILLASRGGLANRQLPSGKKSLSNSSSDCGLEESEVEEEDDEAATESTSISQQIPPSYTNGHYNNHQRNVVVQNTSPLYAQVNKERSENTTTTSANIPNIYRSSAERTASTHEELNSSFDSVLGSNDKLSDNGNSSDNWMYGNSKRPKGFKMPFTEELSQVLAESKG